MVNRRDIASGLSLTFHWNLCTSTQVRLFMGFFETRALHLRSQAVRNIAVRCFRQIAGSYISHREGLYGIMVLTIDRYINVTFRQQSGSGYELQ